MVTIITKDNIGSLTNEGLKKDAQRYIDIYENFLGELREMGANIDDNEYNEEKESLVKELTALGVEIRNNGYSMLWGDKISPSCEDCRTGEGSSTFIVSLKCNRDCFFCVNKNQFDYSFNRDKVNDIIDQFNAANKKYATMRSAGITGGEPLMFMDECVNFLKHVKKRNRKTQTRIYTNGDLATEENLKRLAEAGLDEIRFGLKPEEDGSFSEEVLRNLETAVKYIPRAMVEMPVEPGELERMKALADRFEQIGIYSVNILEYLFPWVHVKDYNAKGYKISKHPYRILFDYSYAGGVSVSGSELECLKLMKYIAEKKYKFGAHYCSLENKLTAQVWHHNRNFKKLPTEYMSQKDYYVKVAKAYGSDAVKAKEILDKSNVKHYSYNEPEQVIEFSVQDISLLKGQNMELGISSLILDRNEEEVCVREVAVHRADTETFSMDDL